MAAIPSDVAIVPGGSDGTLVAMGRPLVAIGGLSVVAGLGMRMVDDADSGVGEGTGIMATVGTRTNDVNSIGMRLACKCVCVCVCACACVFCISQPITLGSS